MSKGRTSNLEPAERHAEQCGRREFVLSACRWLALAGLAALSARVALAHCNPAAGTRRLRLAACRKCAALRGCGLPQALAARLIAR